MAGTDPVPLTDQSLVVHLFVSTTGPHRATAYRRLRAVWAACGRRLGMTRPVPATGLRVALPQQAPALPDGGGLAARCDPSGYRQAIVRRRHDLLFLSVALSPAPGGQGSWAAFDRAWAEAVGSGGEWALGEARVYVAYEAAPGPHGGHADLEDPADPGDRDGRAARLAATVRPLLPDVPQAPGSALPLRLGAPAAVPHPPVVLWEAVPPREPGGHPARQAPSGPYAAGRTRRFVAVAADRGAEPAAAERWLWTQGTGTPPPFARYLADAAKVRYEMRVHAAHDSDLGSPAGPAVAGALAALERSVAAAGEGAQVRGRELPDWRSRLLMLVSGPAGLTQWITRLTEMRATVRIAEANMRARREETGLPDGGQGPFADDAALTAWFSQRLTDGLLYLEADRERARDALAALTAEAEFALQERREATLRAEELAQRRQSRVNLFQSAFLGAVLMVLAAVQTLAYELPFVAPPAVPALIALLGALALLLATLVLWVATPPQERGPGRTGALLAGLVGGTGGWLAATAVTHALTGAGSPLPVTWGAAVPGFAAGWLWMRRLLRRGPDAGGHR
ncbi:CATRA conflict system CASPASE/TPR repeat-associated protein [Streptomyces sp. NPDC004134]|uniref:CATRA conflict system CASPASE/TPR repeat-associated protein n=1 Tax=Streptomyces sp. NPDC004134 TaxID=3364691 RepID=UPI00367EC4BD